jgi:signal transduction histidine kinase
MLKITPLFAILLFCLSPVISSGQKSKIDSLERAARNAKEDSNKVITLNLLTRQIYLRGNYDTATFYANEAKVIAEKINYKKGLANAYNNIGNINMYRGDFSEALKNHSISLKIQTEIGNKAGIASSHNNMGNIYFGQGIYPEALKNYLAAMSIYKELPDVKMSLASAYNNIGNVYFTQGNYSEALKNYQAGLETRKEIGDKQGLAASYGNVGNVYFSLGKFTEALKSDSISLELKKETEDQQGLAATYGNIGGIYFALNNYPEALKSFFASEKIGLELGDKLLLGNAYSNIGETYIRQNKSSDAIQFLNKSLQLGKELGSKEVMKNSYNGLSEADSLQGNWREAYENHKLFIVYRDSLLNEENTQKITQSQMNFDFEQKELRTKAEQEKKDAATRTIQVQKDEEIKRQRIINWFVASSLLLLLFSSLLIFNRYRLKQKNNYQQQLNRQQKEQAVAVMETQEQERKRIAEDLHDSLGHLLSTTKLTLQTVPESQKHLMENPLSLLNQASSEIRNITFNLMPKTLEEEGLVSALNELASKTSGSGSVKMFLQVHGMESTILEKQTQFNIYRIIQEAVNNILKHAEASEINIQLIREGNQLTIMIEDDGKGFDSAVEKKSGRGLRNITTRTQWLNGTNVIDSTPGRGTTISIQIPL